MKRASQVALWTALTIAIGAGPAGATPPPPPPPPDLNVVADLAVGGSDLTQLVGTRGTTYVVVVTNLGPSPAQAVTVTGTLPKSVRITRLMATGCSHTARRFQCSIPIMAARADLTIKVMVKGDSRRLKVSARSNTLEGNIKDNSSVITGRGGKRTGRF